jgi:hypothetical protein
MKRVIRMRDALSEFDDTTAERLLVGDNWNVRDLVAHFVFWTGEAAKRLPEMAAGAPLGDYDIEKINDEVFRKNRRMSFVMLLPQLREAEDRLVEAVRTVQADLLTGESDVREVIDKTIGHYDHHWKPLADALQRLH